METNNFEQQAAANEQAQKHAQEIQKTRVGGLGGSDAALLMKIGERGLSALTMTDNKRLNVMLGRMEQADWAGNAATNAGHMFEDWTEMQVPFGKDEYERERVLSVNLARNFKTFAHADFYLPLDGVVMECKFVQDTTEKTAQKYWAQLQWYYMLGVQTVVLFHGRGTAEPFEVDETQQMKIERDEQAIETLLNGIKILDQALTDGWLPDKVDKIAIEMTPSVVQEAFAALQNLKVEKDLHDKAEADAKKTIKEYIEAMGLTGIVASGDVKNQIIYNRAKTTFNFNSEKFLAEHPEFNLPEYFKQVKTSASVTFK